MNHRTYAICEARDICNLLTTALAQILVGGDSAGGNLSLAVLSAISHPFDGVKPFKLDDKLAGALLISPWVSFETDTPSWKDNHGKDVVSLETVNLLIPAYAKPNEFNNHSEPLRAPNDWWKDAPVRNILNVYGDFEVLRDHQAQFSQKLAESGAKVQDSKCSTQVHIDNILDAQTDLETGEMTDVIWKWLGQVV
jgi:acetyl esterase/lipase